MKLPMFSANMLANVILARSLEITVSNYTVVQQLSNPVPSMDVPFQIMAKRESFCAPLASKGLGVSSQMLTKQSESVPSPSRNRPGAKLTFFSPMN
jgi:hypothetical protein